MARKKKYDTEALVGQLRAERRTGLILSSVGVLFLFFMVGLYFAGSGDNQPVVVPTGTAADIAANRGFEPGSDDPAATGESDPTADPAAEPGDAPEADAGEAEDPTEEPTEEPTDPEPAAGPASVSIAMTKKGVVWVDGKKIGKLKKKTVELQAGEHTIKAKFGRKTVQQTIEVEAGASYTFGVDGRRRRAVLKKNE